ncbi:Uncharacterised protein [Mycobacteroides abscessus subsp. abscessus]|nr:Uncharacterised protein [Mycobacteroides abscessus subsp. abscessus]
MTTVSERTQRPPNLARRTLLIACGATFIALLDLSVVNIAFPSLARDYPDTPVTTLTWVVAWPSPPCSPRRAASPTPSAGAGCSGSRWPPSH